MTLNRRELADALGVTPRAIYYWEVRHKETFPKGYSGVKGKRSAYDPIEIGYWLAHHPEYWKKNPNGRNEEQRL